MRCRDFSLVPKAIQYRVGESLGSTISFSVTVTAFALGTASARTRGALIKELVAGSHAPGRTASGDTGAVPSAEYAAPDAASGCTPYADEEATPSRMAVKATSDTLERIFIIFLLLRGSASLKRRDLRKGQRCAGR
jgi:hypothetical protein